MSSKGKISVFILFLLIIVSFSLAGGAFYFMQQEKTKADTLEKDMETLSSKQRAVQTELESAKRTISDLESKLKAYELQIENLTEDLSTEKAAKEESLNKVSQLKTALELQEKQRADLEAKVVQAQDEIKKFKDELKDLQSKKDELEEKLKGAQASTPLASDDVELGKIVIAPEGPEFTEPAQEMLAQARTKALEGKVLTLNKEYDFVVINLGSKDGVRVNNVFSVYHDNAYLGDVKIDKLHDSMSAATF
ncbi:MAG: hypothetical protein PHG31_06225, partial [Candidatus Omnitrophica bacterium]|nr:hypothetical protein [Candidatus Omnitrophota bacterium]